MSLAAVFRVPCPTDSPFGPDSWDSTVGKSTPVRVVQPGTLDGTGSVDTVCTAVQVAPDGAYADLHLTVFVDDPGLVLGLFVPAEVLSIEPAP